MIGKFTALLFLAGFSLPESTGIQWPELRGKYTNPLDVFHLYGFFEEPKTEQEAQAAEWTTPQETSGNDLTTTYCRNSDPSVCLVYDKKGNVAGYELSIPRAVDELDLGINYTTKGFKPTARYGQNYYTTLVLLESLDDINNGGRQPDGNVASGLWLPVKDDYLEIPLKDSDIPSKAPVFTKQLCFPGMGLHYFYDVRPDTTKDEYQPWFILYDNDGNLHGFGMVVFGAKTKKQSFWSKVGSFFKASRNWWENVPSSIVDQIAPTRPDWFLEYIDKFGTFAHHVYFIEKPWNIDCPAK